MLLSEQLQFQSTHPCRVRLSDVSHDNRLSYFNPRTRAGCDGINLVAVCKLSDFNPRTRAGCDSVFLKVVMTLYDFNPRTRAGCDC